MKQPFAVAALFSALASPAFGADLLTVKATPGYAPPPAFSWTGFYLGANAGLSAGTFNTTDRIGTYGTGDQTTAASKGFSGGGQLGYNYQLPGSNVVVGIEADFQGSTLQGTYDSTQAGGAASQDGSKVDWWGTARGRIGYAFGNVLPYATGGLLMATWEPAAAVRLRHGHFPAINPRGRFQGHKLVGRQVRALNMRSPAI